ncbi:MAG: hypothetical protein DCC68_23530 [Planctomycetota bacterium]|nr:MAG: hypothetical protein DCC68_23530 [Planctomycetota bacterium]
MLRSILVAFLLFLAPTFAAADIIVGAGPGGGPQVKVFDGQTGATTQSFFAYGPSFTGGVRVAAGDVNGDGLSDIITGAGAGGGPHVKVFDGQTGAEIRSFLAFAPASGGGVFVAAGDLDGDGRADIVAGTDTDVPAQVKAFDGATGSEVRSFFPYTPSFMGGVRVAAGDVNGDGFDDIITGTGPGGGPHVKVFDGTSGVELRSFFAYDATFAGGVFVAAGDLDGDGFADLVTGTDEGAAAHVKVFDGKTGDLAQSFLPYGGFTGGVRVAVGDLDGDGLGEIITGAGPGAGPHVRVFSGQTGAELQSFFAFEGQFPGGVYVAAANIPEPSALLLAASAVAIVAPLRISPRAKRRRAAR